MQKFWFKIVLVIFIISTVGSVQNVLGAEQDQSGKELQSSEDLFNSKLTGDWYGQRTKLADNGITFNMDLVQTWQGVFSGGLDKSWTSGGSFDYELNLDFEKMGLWPGAFVDLRAEQQYGIFANDKTGSLSGVNADGFFPLPDEHDMVLSKVVFTQFLSEQFAIFFGKIDTLDGDNNVFAGGRGKENFLNQNFIFNPATLRTSPYSALGFGAAVFLPTVTAERPTILNFTVLGANGQPDELGCGEDFDDGAVYAVEVSFPTDFFNKPGRHLFGGTYSEKEYTVLDVDSRFVLVSLIKAKLGLIPAVSLPKNDDSWSFYYNFHQYVFTGQEDPSQGFGLFGRFGLADDETSPIEQFYSIGIGGKGIIDSRDNDTFGVGYYHIELSDKLPSVLLSRFGDSDGFELFYNFEVSPWLHITPDFQVVSPSDKSVDTAYIAGVRIKVDF